MSDRNHKYKPRGPQNLPVYTLWHLTFFTCSRFSHRCVWESAAASGSGIGYSPGCSTCQSFGKAAAVGLQECLGSVLASTGRHPATSRYKLSKLPHHRYSRSLDLHCCWVCCTLCHLNPPKIFTMLMWNANYIKKNSKPVVCLLCRRKSQSSEGGRVWNGGLCWWSSANGQARPSCGGRWIRNAEPLKPHNIMRLLRDVLVHLSSNDMPFRRSVPSQLSQHSDLSFCRFKSSGNKHGACDSQSTVSGQIGSTCWMLPSRDRTTRSADPPWILPLPRHPSACPTAWQW